MSSKTSIWNQPVSRPVRLTVIIVLLALTIVMGYALGKNETTPETTVTTTTTPISTTVTTPAVTTTTPATTVTAPVSNKFSIATAKVGDKVASMTITSVKQGQVKGEGIVEFSGEAVVTGKYTYNADGIIQDEVCVDSLDSKSLNKIPLANGDERDVWFCFSNKDLARKEFSPKGSTGTATVAINKYILKLYGAEVWNTAELTKVQSKI